ncbi:hypothetical protein KEM56_004831, partial [Ascosphaera pollenicola]
MAMRSEADRDSPVLNETLSFINAHITKLNANSNAHDDGTRTPLSPITSRGYAETDGDGEMMTMQGIGRAAATDYHDEDDNGDGDYTTMMPEPETESEDDEERRSTLLPPGLPLHRQQQRIGDAQQQQPGNSAHSSKRYTNTDSASEYSANLSVTNLAANHLSSASSQQYNNYNYNHPLRQQQQQQQHPPSTAASNSTTTSSAFLHPDTIRTWSPAEVASYLLSIGVDPNHCAVFEEQEITGDILLEMDQSTMFMKEFNFGTMGRRLKTWYRIKAFQEEVLGISTPDEGLRTSSRAGQGSRSGSRSTSRMGGGGGATSAQGMHYGIGAAIAEMRNSVASSIRTSLVPPGQDPSGQERYDAGGFLPRIPSASGDRPASPPSLQSQGQGQPLRG